MRAVASIKMWKSSSGVEKNGLWSLCVANTWEGGHDFIIKSCFSFAMSWSFSVLTKTRGTLSAAAPPSNQTSFRALTGAGLSSIEANT